MGKEMNILQRKYMDGRQAHEICNTISHHENAQ